MKTRDARLLWKHLNGIVCIYKPPMISWFTTRKILLSKLTSELNELDCRPQRPHVNIDGDTSKELFVNVIPSYADHTLTIGPRYIPEEVKALPVNNLGSLISGVFVLGINGGCRTAQHLKTFNPLSTFRVTAQLGMATDDKMSTGKIIFRCGSSHVKRINIDKAVMAIEANNKKSLFTLSGVHPQSQAAYDLLSQGPYRPSSGAYPFIYSIKCIDLKLPYFTLEIATANEKACHLLDTVEEIGIRLRNCAVTTSIQCIRNSYFSLEDALLKKHWTLQNIIDNMAHCDKILANNRHFGKFLQEVKKEEKAEIIAHEDDNDALEEENSISTC